MNKSIFLLFVMLFVINGFTQSIQDYKRNHSQTYENTIALYEKLSDKYSAAKLIEVGQTDVGKPLHLFIIDNLEKFEPFETDHRMTLLINNGIHPGEPCGIDASIKFANELLKSDDFKERVKNTVICIIPIYNVGGSLNRGCCSRANQNGPEEYGFRGNAKNLDLNRDFVKLDSENAKTFNQIFQKWNPDIMVDTHTSNGADYQYTMTLLTTQLDKLNEVFRPFMNKKMLPYLYNEMETKGWPMIPYVNPIKKTPNDGIYDYLETPRFATGYAAQFNCIGFTSETHMWKPFPDRVESTYDFLNTIHFFSNTQSREIKMLRQMAFDRDKSDLSFPVNYKLDTNVFEIIPFKGFEVEYYTSEISGLQTYRYNRNKPIELEIKRFSKYNPTAEIKKPKYYLISQAWKKTIDRLKLNNIKMIPIKEDSTLIVNTYYINPEMDSKPYEGHQLHSNVKVTSKEISVSIMKGDFLIPCNQKNIRFIIEQLEPTVVDSYFAWNMFDEILFQKEYFSSYIFEEKALQLLKDNPEIKQKLDTAKTEDKNLANSHWMQLYFIYKHSNNYENTHMRYPVYRID